MVCAPHPVFPVPGQAGHVIGIQCTSELQDWAGSAAQKALPFSY